MRSTSASAAVRARRSTAERAAEIALAAEALALEDGLAAVTLRGVGGRVGVAPSLVAHYESSMDRLVAQSFRAVAEQEVREVAAAVERAADPVDALRALLDAVADPARDDVGALWADAWSMGRRNPDLAEAARACMDQWQSLATTVVERGVRSGDFRTADVDGVGVLLFALVDATNAYALVDYRQPAERERLIRGAVAAALGVPPERLGHAEPSRGGG